MKQTEQNHTRVPARRVLAGALAAVLTAACLATAAFAASPELRTAVLSLFRMEESEQVPSQSGASSQPDISQAEIGQLVKAQYIRMDSRRYGFSNGLLNDLTWSDDWKALLDAKFWEVQEGKLIPVEINMNTSTVDITFKGIRYQGEFYWFVQEGELCCLSPDNRSYDETAELETDWNLTEIPGRTDAVLLRLSTGRQIEYTEYPMLYHLDTGEAEDILAGTGADQLEHAYSYEWSENMRRAIILTGGGPDEIQTWLCDREAKTLTLLDSLVDIDVYTAAFAGSNALILYEASQDSDGILQDVALYTYDLSTGGLTQLLKRTPYYRYWEDNPSGVLTLGSRCILISEEGQVQTIDLNTGAQTILEGFTFRKEDQFQLNPSGDKLLYYTMDTAPDGLGISQIGVADLEKGSFFAFDREGYDKLRETSIGWVDDSTVSITADTRDSELGTRYLLLYQF